MKVRLFVAQLFNAMLQDHVPPEEIISESAEVLGQISQQAMNSNFWVHAVKKGQSQEDLIKDADIHLNAFVNNFVEIGIEPEVIRAVMFAQTAQAAFHGNITREQWLELAAMNFDKAEAKARNGTKNSEN